MADGSKIVPIKVNLDVAADYAAADTARFIKNLSTNIGANNTYVGVTEGQNKLILKSLQSNELYVPNMVLPEGDNICVGAKGFAIVNRVYVWCFNSNGNHFIYRINGNDRTFEMVKVAPYFNFQLNPKYFIHKQGAWLEIVYLTNPVSGEIELLEDLYWTDGFNYIGYTRVNDCIATNGFDPTKFIYFQGNYNPDIFFRMGLPTPKSCINVVEIPRTPDTIGEINGLLFNTWQFRISVTDVFGRPSEHSIISDIYIPGINDCIGSNQSLPNCLNLIFDAGNPLWNTIDVEYRNCNDEQWYKTDTLFLYNGSAIGEWWTRQRNTDIQYNPIDNTITYQFCADGEQNAIPTTETNRLENPIPKRCQTLNKIGDRIGTANNVDGFLPFSQDLTKLITTTVIPPAQVPIISRTITLYIPIYSIGANIINGVNNNQNGNYFAGVVKDSTSGYVWGSGSNGKGDGVKDYSQYFPDDKQSGFPGYLLGSQSVAISTQVYIDNSGNIIDDPNYNGVGLGFLCFQKLVFPNLRPDSYVVRLASHLANPATLGQQTLPGDVGTFFNLFDTSTTVFGVCPFNKDGFKIDVNDRNTYQELLINVCDGDYDTFGVVGTNTTNQILVIADVSFSNGASCGYSYESRLKGFSQYPMELMQIIPSANTTTSKTTDHNGFYWSLFDFGSRTINLYSFDFYFYNNCIKQHVTSVFLTNFGMGFFSFYMDEIGSQIVNTGAPAYPEFLTTPCNRIEVTGNIFLTSNNDVGVPNVLVVLTRGQFIPTDDSGNYVIIAHDDVTNNGVRNDVIVFSGSVCNYKSIDGCIPTQLVLIEPCIFGSCMLREVVVNDFYVIYLAQRGLLSGGTYGVGCDGWDWLGRSMAIQDEGKITIPTIVQSQTIGVSQVQINISPDATFPSYIEYLTFWLTQELTIETYIDWIVDRFDLIDNTGNININAPTQIRIYYGSLNQFNVENNFNTTTNWQFLEPLPTGQATGSQQPFTTDVVNFLFNESQGFYFGKLPQPPGFIPKQITALVKYDQTGQFFLIDYTSELAGLKSGALIRLSRPRNVVNEFEPYFEICKIVEVVNGKAQENQFILNAFDTYYLDRQIPVPTPIAPNPQPAPTPTQTAVVSGDTTTYSTPVPVITTLAGATGFYTPVPVPSVINLQIFPFPFESDSPSNFWGKGCKNIGRINTKNPYETEILSINQIALGDTLSATGQLSFLQYFDDALKTNFIVQNTGGIVSMIYRQGFVFFITQYSKFLVGYNDNNIRVNEKGEVTVPSAADKFGNPETDLQNEYGCQLKDKSGIIEINGLVHFPDSIRAHYLQYDFKQVLSMTANQCDAWFRAKCKEMQDDPLRYFVASDNPIGNKLLLSDFSLTTPTYINQERTYNAKVNETISFDVATRDLEMWTGFIGEMYASLTGDVLNNNLFSFKNGVPYNHYNLNESNSFCNFFGVQTGKVLTPISNKEAFKKKNYLAISIYCVQSKWFSDQIITEAGQLSYLYLSDFQQAMYFTYAAFLRNVNTLNDPNQPPVINNNPLQEGEQLYGTNIQVRLISDPANDNNYCEVLGIIIDAIDYEKTG